MTKDEIISKMREAGLKAPARGDFIFIHWDQIAMLLDHERTAEREACAKICEPFIGSTMAVQAERIQSAILSRGQT